MASTVNPRLARVENLLAKFEHPLLVFSAREHGDGVQITINFKNITVPVHTYTFDIHARDLEHPQLEWTLERQIYDGLHDYLVEMFTRAPHTRTE